MSKVLIITGDPIGARMAGPAIRSWNMATALARENEVTLVTTTNLEQVDAPFELRRIRPGENAEFNELERWADMIVFQGHAMNQFEVLKTTSKVVVVDIYDPMHLEMLEQGQGAGARDLGAAGEHRDPRAQRAVGARRFLPVRV